MNSPWDENKKRQNEESSTPEGETKLLEASTVKCFPAVKRSFRQKHCNWRWRWKYFTRALQPISEQGENTKDDTSKVDESGGNSAVDGASETSSDSLVTKEQENLDSSNQHLEDCRHNVHNDNKSDDSNETVHSKEDYSACIKLIEKFQEAVLDNAVRVIQAAYKQFRERRRFLKLKKSATVIQRSVRQWLVLRHSKGLPALPSTKPDCEHDNGVQENCCDDSKLEREISSCHIESEDPVEQRHSVDEDSFDGDRTSFGQHLESSVDFCRRVVTLVCSAKKTQQSVRSVAYHGAPFDSIADPRGCLQLVGSVMGGAFLPVFLLHGLFLSPCRELSQREEVSKRRNFKGEGP